MWVDTIAGLIPNLINYEKLAKEGQLQRIRRPGRVGPKPSEPPQLTPGHVHDWYYIPALNLVGAARFCAYKNPSPRMESKGGAAVTHFAKLGWFEEVEHGDPRYGKARARVVGLRASVQIHAKFHALKPRYDDAVTLIFIPVE